VPIDLVIFNWDGVPVDSEVISCRARSVRASCYPTVRGAGMVLGFHGGGGRCGADHAETLRTQAPWRPPTTDDNCRRRSPKTRKKPASSLDFRPFSLYLRHTRPKHDPAQRVPVFRRDHVR
jgi:beta-phosphoglucomutase-like phosphatase (HAD superfamily)